MKKNLFITLSLLLISTVAVFSQEGSTSLPSVDIQTMDSRIFNTSDLENDGKPMIISFWATWCSPCKRELNNIADMYIDWQAETGVKLVAISIDDARNMGKVAPYVNGKAWDYEIYLDPNGDFKRAMGVNNVPHTFLLNGEGEVVWQHNSYAEGDEYHLYELVTKLAAGESIEE